MKVDYVNKVGIAGAGFMGSGIAQILAQANYDVVVYDLKSEYLSRGREAIERNQAAFIEFDLLDKQTAEQALGRIEFTTEIKRLAEVDLLIEAIIEKLDVKQAFWGEASRMVNPDCLLASNTSGLSITAIAKEVEGKGRFAGMHWWNPPHIVPLVEVILGQETEMKTAAQLIEIAEGLGKQTVLVKKDVPGFIGNRINHAVVREAMYMLEQGIASAEDIDKACKYGPGFRYPILGPLQIADVGNLTTWNNVASYLFADLCKDDKPPKVLQDLIDNNNFGVNTGKGFFDYSNGRDKEVLRARDLKFLKMLKHIMVEN